VCGLACSHGGGCKGDRDGEETDFLFRIRIAPSAAANRIRTSSCGCLGGTCECKRDVKCHPNEWIGIRG
jgi:hypothetical protein